MWLAASSGTHEECWYGADANSQRKRRSFGEWSRKKVGQTRRIQEKAEENEADEEDDEDEEEEIEEVNAKDKKQKVKQDTALAPTLNVLLPFITSLRRLFFRSQLAGVPSTSSWSAC